MATLTAKTSAPRLSGLAQQGKTFSLADVGTTSGKLPNRYGLYGATGWGKTTMAAYAPAPVFLETRGETGLESLMDAGQLPKTPHFPEIETWDELMSALKVLRREAHAYKTLVIDTGNGAEKLLHEHVCRRDFDGDWSDQGFLSYNKGFDVAMADWRLFLNELDALRKEKSMTIFMLFHSRVKTFKNPTGGDYDRYAPEMHDKTWALTKGWLDAILFGNFEVLVKSGAKETEAHKKGKAHEVSTRVLCANSDNPTYDAKNRLGLPDEIEMGANGKEAWSNLAAAIRAARTVQNTPETAKKNEVESDE